MGGIIRRVERTFKKVAKEAGKAAGVVPTNKERAAQEQAARRAQEQAAEAEKQRRAEEALKAQQAVEVVDAPSDPNNPGDVVYSGDQGAGKPKKKPKKKGGTIMTGAQGVMGDAPTEKSTLLGG